MCLLAASVSPWDWGLRSAGDDGLLNVYELGFPICARCSQAGGILALDGRRDWPWSTLFRHLIQRSTMTNAVIKDRRSPARTIGRRLAECRRRRRACPRWACSCRDGLLVPGGTGSFCPASARLPGLSSPARPQLACPASARLPGLSSAPTAPYRHGPPRGPWRSTA